MKFRFAHNCLYVRDLARSIDFYEKALGLHPVRTMRPGDMDIDLVFLSDGVTGHELELGCPAGWDRPFDLGDNFVHIAFAVEDMAAAHGLHESMGIICRDPAEEPVYFIHDPDGYMIEIIPEPKE